LDFQVQPAEQRRRLWPLLVAGAAIVALLLVAVNWAAHRSASRSPAIVLLPFGSAEQSYEANLRFENLRMSRFGNMLNQDITYVSGQVVNGGNRTIKDVQVTVEFRNVANKVVMRETLRLLGSRPAPIAVGDRRDFQLGFEQVPDDWNMQNPSVRVTGLLFQ
jgi:hypothetical protein